MMQEEWRISPSFPCYEVSSHGNVRRCDNSPKSYKNGENMKLTIDKDGYFRIGLCMNGKSHTAIVHLLVAEAFIGPRPEGLEVNHIDGVKSNNFWGNLEYTTQLENLNHKTRMGLCARGDKNGDCKLTPEDVIQMRALAKSGVTQKEIAKRYGMGESTTSSIIRGYIWSHVEGSFPSGRKIRKDKCESETSTSCV